jgi:hypothetical protein
MINLLISANPESWKPPSEYFAHDRCLTEYIMPELRSRFSSLGENEIAQLLELPTIFAYEQFNREDALIGNITGITVRQQNVKIDFTLTGERIRFKDFVSMESLLDIGKWELNRTHWTVKNVSLTDVTPFFSNDTSRKTTVFISYSWTPPENQRNVFSLVEKLKADGITVIYDKDNLRPGQDKDYFMEQALTNHEIDKVLVVCNREYAEKANSRQGGVGRESEIIISQISSQPLQTKFIPIAMETDAGGKAFLPTAFKSRLYIDLTKESGYEELLSAIQSNDGEQ